MNEFNLESAKDFLVNYLDCASENLDEILYDDLCDGDYDRVLYSMVAYARKMCDIQKGICANEAEIEDYCDYVYGDLCTFQRINSNSILNTPYPKEIRYDDES